MPFSLLSSSNRPSPVLFPSPHRLLPLQRFSRREKHLSDPDSRLHGAVPPDPCGFWPIAKEAQDKGDE